MSNYTNVVYTSDKNTTWFKMFNNIPQKARVLDVGCSSGNFGAVLAKEKNCEVVGVDLDKDDISRAKKVLNAAYVMSIENDDFSKLGSFDRVIFADVLEHLMDPVASLKKVKKLLRPGGQVLFSIPNMAHMGTRLLLLTGKFGYGETGLLDKTHLHFYDEDEVRRIFNDAGFTLDTLDWTEYYIPQVEVKSQLARVGLKPSREFLDNAKNVAAVALQYVGAASAARNDRKTVKLPGMSPWVSKTDEYIQEYTQNADEQVRLMQDQMNSILNSTSWKLTRPLRTISSVARSVVRKK